MKRLSIVITNYNKGDRIITLLTQLKDQIINRIDTEIIIIDDYSTDGSREKIESFLSSYNESTRNSFSLYINEENLGPGISRNRGLDHCTGEWITFIDGDDEVVDSYIGTLSNIMFDTDADLICFDYEAINCISDEPLTYALNTMLWTKLFRASIFYDNHIRVDETRFKGLVFGEDIELLYLYMCKTDKYIKISDRLIKYNWGIGICNRPPEKYESSIPDGWERDHRWLFTFNHDGAILDFSITSHCNRRCSNCIALIPYYNDCDRKHDDIEDIKNRLDLLLPHLDVISILGGETFLHPHLLDIIKYVKDSGVRSIYVYTNGEIEPDNLQDIINVMDSRFTISITKYPQSKIFDYKKYTLPYGVKWRIVECDWFYCGAPEENNEPKTWSTCTPKTFINKKNKVYLCHRFSTLDEKGIAKLDDNEWCYIEDFGTFKHTFNSGFTKSCKYCLYGTEKCINVPSGS